MANPVRKKLRNIIVQGRYYPVWHEKDDVFAKIDPDCPLYEKLSGGVVAAVTVEYDDLLFLESTPKQDSFEMAIEALKLQLLNTRVGTCV